MNIQKNYVHCKKMAKYKNFHILGMVKEKKIRIKTKYFFKNTIKWVKKFELDQTNFCQCCLWVNLNIFNKNGTNFQLKFLKIGVYDYQAITGTYLTKKTYFCIFITTRDICINRRPIFFQNALYFRRPQ